MKKWTLSIILLLASVLGINLSVEAKSFVRTSVFKDLNVINYYYEAMYSLYLKEVIIGEEDQEGNVFISPNKIITRAEAAFMLYQLLGMTPEDGIHFSDIKDDQWYADAISAITNKKIMIGYPDGTFKPDEPLTRAHMAKIITKSFNYQLPTKISNDFTDVNKTYESFVEALYVNGITTGISTTKYAPNMYIPRKQMATFLTRAFSQKKGSLYNKFEVMNIVNESTRKVRILLTQGLAKYFPLQRERNIETDLLEVATHPYYSNVIGDYVTSCYLCDGANVPRDLDFGLFFNLKNVSDTSIIVESASPRTNLISGFRTHIELVKVGELWKVKTMESQNLSEFPLQLGISDAMTYISFRLMIDYQIDTVSIKHMGKDEVTGNEIFRVNEVYGVEFNVKDGFLLVHL